MGSEDLNADRNVSSKGQSHAVSLVMKTLLGPGLEAMCYTMPKSLDTFCLCPKILCELQFKGSWLIDVVEEILRQPNIQDLVWILLNSFG